MLPPKRATIKSHGKMPAMQATIPERKETLESSGELEYSFEKDVSKSTETQLSRNVQSTLDHDLSTPATVATSKASVKSARQNSPSSELMRKLSQRRQKLEQQLVAAGKHTSGSTTSSGAGGDSSRCTSTSSTQSELVCAYHTKRLQEDAALDRASPVDVELRSKDEANLTKYGIVEDTEGGSYVI